MRGRVLAGCLIGWAVALCGASLADEPRLEAEGQGWIGVWLADADDGGVRVVAVVPGSPAAEAGIESGDIVLEVDRQAVTSLAGLGSLLRLAEPGNSLVLRVVRGGKPVRQELRVGRRGTQVSGAPFAGWPLSASPRVEVAHPLQSTSVARAVGLRVADVTPDLRRYYGAPESSGVLVTRVEPGHLADDAGFAVGDVLVAFGEQELTDQSGFERTLRSWNLRRPISVSVVRGGEVRTVLLDPQVADPSNPPESRQIRAQRIELEIRRLQRRIRELEWKLRTLTGEDLTREDDVH